MTYVEKAEKVAQEDREFVRGELAWVAEWLRNRSNMGFREVNRFLHEVLGVSV